MREVAHPCPSLGPSAAVEPAPLPDDEDENDPYYFGWRDLHETLPDGSEKLRRVPLTYRDLLDPQVGDFIAENTIHHEVIAGIESILRRRYETETTVAVWGDLKIAFVIPGLTTGPGPDVCVIAGVRDRDRLRTSFRYGEEPGELRLAIEVVSQKSKRKDYEDILEIYSRLGVEDYIAIRPTGLYAEGPFELRGWRRDPRTNRLRPLQADPQGRLHLRATGLLIGTGAEGWGLQVWDAATGERLRTVEEEAVRQTARADHEAAARRQAEEEIERLRARLQERERDP